MLNASGGVIDDLIVYFMTEEWFRLVVNSATRDKDLAWIGEHAQPFGVTLQERDDLALIAVQGPQAQQKAQTVFSDAQRRAVSGMKPFSASRRTVGLSLPPVIPAKAAMKSRCRTRRPPGCGSACWPLA